MAKNRVLTVADLTDQDENIVSRLATEHLPAQFPAEMSIRIFNKVNYSERENYDNGDYYEFIKDAYADAAQMFSETWLAGYRTGRY